MDMKLYTECFWEDWDRIVDIYPESVTKLPDYINDDSTYKIIILEKGILQITTCGVTCEAKAPSLILLSQHDKIENRVMQSIKAHILFFKPSVIRDEFSFDRIDSGEFKNMYGQSIYQDYTLIQFFTEFESIKDRITTLPLNGLKRLKELFTSAEVQLKGQQDGFWPCRSRSYLMEMLYLIVYSYLDIDAAKQHGTESDDQAEFSKISEYLNEHIEEQITLETLTKEFSINRNKLNELFMNQSSMTCLNYLLNLRIDLAKILLTKTELQISEIGSRVGYPDSNYFTKVFKKSTGKTPSQYRNS